MLEQLVSNAGQYITTSPHLALVAVFVGGMLKSFVSHELHECCWDRKPGPVHLRNTPNQLFDTLLA